MPPNLRTYPFPAPARAEGGAKYPTAGRAGNATTVETGRILVNMEQTLRRIRRFFGADDAVSTLEYAMMVGLIATAVGAAIVTFSGDVQTAITGIGDDVAGIEITGVTDPAADTTAP